jgi:hypothetical protein
MKGIAAGLTVLLLGLVAAGFVTGKIIELLVNVPFILAMPILPYIFYILAAITLLIDIWAIYKAATYKGW